MAVRSASFYFSSSEAGSSFECRLDGVVWLPCSSPKAYSGLADGRHSFEVRARDAAGNVDASPASRTWVVDTVAPDTTIAGGPTPTTTATLASFGFGSADPTARFECRLDGGAWTRCGSPKAYTNLLVGGHSFQVRARDAAGNADATPASATWTVKALPDTAITSGPSGAGNPSSASFGFSSADPFATFECRLDGVVWLPCSSPKAYSGLADGPHSFEVRASDLLGNVDASPASRTWTVDTAAPDTAITSGPSGTSNAATASLGFSSTEAGSSFDCRLDGGAWAACSAPKSYSGLSDGQHTFDVRAIDPAGNADQTPASSTWTVDTAGQPPACSLPPTGDYYVDPTGNDSNDGRSRAGAFQTIAKALAVARSGDTVLVTAGTYHVQVNLALANSGITLLGEGPGRTVIDGDNVRTAGINLTNGVHDVTVKGFEIKNLTASGSGRAVGILSYNTYNAVIENNEIHDVHAGNSYSYGIYLGFNSNPGLVHDVLVKNNTVHDIGPGGESTGVFLNYAKQMRIEGNTVYLVRKEGIRDWEGLDNTITGNKTLLSWGGLSLNGSNGDVVTNNYSYANTWGLIAKHLSHNLTSWGLSEAHWTKVWHNTFNDNLAASVAVGQSPPTLDYLDLRDNILAAAGSVQIHDFPVDRGSNIVVDGNAYSDSSGRPLYYTTWNSPHPNTYSTLATIQQQLGWEQNGQTFNAQFRDPTTGDLDLLNEAALAPGVDVGDSLGAQVGARGLGPAALSWTSHRLTVAGSSPATTYSRTGAADARNDTYWWSQNYAADGWVTFDLGQPKRFNTIVLDIYSHLDPRNIKNYAFEVSDDNVNFQPLTSGTNPDSEGSSYSYTLGQPVTGRYVKFKMIDNFGGASLIFSDILVGDLEPAAPPGC